MITLASRPGVALTLTVVEVVGEACRVCLRGRLDATTVELAVAVIEYEVRCGRRRLLIDLSEVEHAEPAAIDVLATTRRTMLGGGATLSVAGLRPAVLAGRHLAPVRTGEA